MIPFKLEDWYIFLLLLLRASFLLFFLPVMNSRYIPSVVRVVLSLFLAYVGFIHLETVGFIKTGIPKSFPELVFVVLRELIFCFSVSQVARIIFYAVELAGEYISYLMGFSVVNVLDPTSESSVPIMSHLQSIVLMLLFLLIGGHLWFMKAYSYSLDFFPVTNAPMIPFNLVRYIVNLLGRIFVLSIYLNAPLLIVMIIVQFVLAFISRLLPQLNVFMVGFPLQVLVGFVTILISINTLSLVFSRELLRIREYIDTLMRILSG